MAGIVVDSSIALSWCLPDEDTIDEIQREVAERGAIAPLHWRLEVANALLMAERRQRITAAFRNAVLQDLGNPTDHLDDETWARAWEDIVQDADMQVAAHALRITLLAR